MMRKIAFVPLAAAAAALLPLAPAAAQQAPAGHTWRHGGPGQHMPPHQGGPVHHVPPRHVGSGQHMPPHHAFPPHGAPPHAGAPQHGWVYPPHYRGPRYSHVPRLQRGHRMAHFWWGPQFHVQNWRLYGLHQPRDGHRWVRYYDDAYLIDRDGMVMDGRHGLDWDQYGEPWDHRGGIPQYVGTGDWRPGAEDHAWVEQHGQLGYAEGPPGYVHPGYDHVTYGGMPQGCACGGVVTVTTTTVTTHPVVTRTYVTEEVVETVRQRRAAPVRRAPPPRRIAPVKGERG
ncbi:MAG: RcnB family protein [Allosphingosinicella sp.]|uniref:RcnB family protein n=1 Tax=Allosphingosinicella sp. TaxID=2823234 RepID=UPI00392660E3